MTYGVVDVQVVEAPTASVVTAHVTGPARVSVTSSELRVTRPVFVRSNDHRIVSPASVRPSWFTSVAVPCLTRRIAASWSSSVSVDDGGDVTVADDGSTALAVAVLVTS